MSKGKYFWGIVLIVLGAGLILHQAGVLDLSVASRFIFPALLLLIALTDLINRGLRTFNVVVLVAGVYVFLHRLDKEIDFTAFDFNFIYLFAFILVAVGISLLIRGNVGCPWRPKRVGTSSSDIVAIFGGREDVYMKDVFEEASVTAIFGGVAFDLRQTQISNNAVVHATAIFGGVDILVPPGCRVEVSGVPVFGGVDNQTAKSAQAPDAPVLLLDAVAIFGGVDVKYNK